MESGNLQQEWEAVTAAPYLSIAMVFAIICAVWVALHFLFRHRIEGFKEEIGRGDAEAARLMARIAEYEAKAGSTPDEARARIDALEARIARLQPRRLSTQQEAAMVQALAGTTGLLNLLQHVGPSDSAKFTDDIGRVFTRAGWQVHTSAVMMGGLTVGVQLTPHEISAAARAVAGALQAASVDFESEAMKPPTMVGAAATILVGHRSDD